ncbi:thiolase family protein (plasmid) [Nocardioides sp. R1-1]|uniref:thiolase family protein n=1 Tax=Nocardioides sp. R1-1 TaxID=3383502 RepID=UPI0038D173DE
MHGRAVFVVDAVRTPLGKYGGALSGVRPDDLAAATIRALLARNVNVDPERIGEVYFGNANGAGEENRNVARMAGLLAGLPTSVPGSTMNRLCASGLDAVVMGARAIATGDADTLIAGGVESMTRAPWVVPKPERPYPAGDAALVSTTLGWRLVNPKMPSQWSVSLGEATEQLAAKHGIGRDECDQFAARSHALAAQAWETGSQHSWVIDVAGCALTRDESIRDQVTSATLATLRPSFRPDGIVTAGNASPLSDGAAAVLLMSEQALHATGAEPLARVGSTGVHAVDPQDFGIAPVGAVDRALTKIGRSVTDVEVMELNEAFAAQSLACLKEWPDLDPERVNRQGGAIAMGHPLGCSGARLTGALAHQLAGGGGSLGVAALCVGVGQGLALTLES